MTAGVRASIVLVCKAIQSTHGQNSGNSFTVNFCPFPLLLPDLTLNLIALPKPFSGRLPTQKSKVKRKIIPVALHDGQDMYTSEASNWYDSDPERTIEKGRLSLLFPNHYAAGPQ